MLLPPCRRLIIAALIATSLLLAFGMAVPEPTHAIAPDSHGPSSLATDVGGPIAPGTVWTAAESPYVTTSDIQVPEGVTLTIEPGVTVRLGQYHDIDVSGAIEAMGTEEQPISFEWATEDQHWGTMRLLAGSGPSRITHAVFLGGGARRKSMLEMTTDDAVVTECTFRGSRGVGVDIRQGASPTLSDSVLIETTPLDADPPAALRIYGPSDAVIERNFFQSNIEAIRMDAEASPKFFGNRFGYNGINGVMVRGIINRDVVWPSLGPRDWAYHVHSTGVVIETEGSLTIEAGATLRHGTAASIRVRGTLRALGQAANKVVFTADQDDPKAGQWPEIKFEDPSTDYDPETGEGSVIDHAIIEYGGSSRTGAVYIKRSSPLIANTTIRRSGTHGMTVYGEEAHPIIRGSTFDSISEQRESIALFVTQGAAPDVSFSVFKNNMYGVRTEIGSQPILGPHNRFAFNLSYGVFNADDTVCVPAPSNDWSGARGPQDVSAQPDACGLGANPGDGDSVSDNVKYVPFEGQLPIPVITGPLCGTILDSSPVITGLAPPNTEITVYDNQEVIGHFRTGAGEEGVAEFSYAPDPLAKGSHVIQVQAQDGSDASGLSEPLELLVDPDARLDPAMTTISMDLNGIHYVIPYNYLDEAGCRVLNDQGAWRVRAHPGAPLNLNARISCPSGSEPQAGIEFEKGRYDLTKGDDDLYHTTFEMTRGGPLAIDITCDGAKRTWNLATLNIEYEGFVFEQEKGPLARIEGATVTLYEYDAGLNDYVLWHGDEYYGQTNPQVTGDVGWYGFYPPPGRYIVRAEAKGFQSFMSTPQTITVEPIVLTIGLNKVARPVLLPSLRKHVR